MIGHVIPRFDQATSTNIYLSPFICTLYTRTVQFFKLEPTRKVTNIQGSHVDNSNSYNHTYKMVTAVASGVGFLNTIYPTLHDYVETALPWKSTTITFLYTCHVCLDAFQSVTWATQVPNILILGHTMLHVSMKCRNEISRLQCISNMVSWNQNVLHTFNEKINLT